MRRGCVISLLFAVAALVGCGYSGPYVGTLRQTHDSTKTATPAAIEQLNRAISSRSQDRLVEATPDDYRLGPEDLIEITIFNIPPSEVGVTPRTTELRVNPNGIIPLPLIGNIRVARLTADEVREVLTKEYDKYIHQPQIGIRILEHFNMQVSVLGAVRDPGMFKLTSGKTVIDMLAMAKGVSDLAGAKLYLHRKAINGRETHIIDLRALTIKPKFVDKPVYAGDAIYVPQAKMFYVDGAVKSPGAYPLTQQYTLTQALASAGGLNRELADLTEISIIRMNGDDSVSISYNLDDVLAGKLSDPKLEAEDVVLVPINGFKYFVRRFVGGISLGRYMPAPPGVN
jgi:polysaccharide biosynthesis/export protein